MIIFLYGAPGSGKTTIGREVCGRLGFQFADLDDEIQRRVGKAIPDIFTSESEAGFRAHESILLREILANAGSRGDDLVLALGGGTLLNSENRILAEAIGRVVFLEVPHELLAQRVQRSPGKRPLLAGNTIDRMSELLEQRSEHYASFHWRVDASRPLMEIAWQVQVLLGAFQVTGMGNGYDVRVIPDGLSQIGKLLHDRKLNGPVALVSDETVASLYAERVIHSLEAAGYPVWSIVIPPGEAHKTMEMVGLLWTGFLESGLERTSTVVALGGGVVGDLAGFAAATYLRGVKWVSLPTTLLAMVDASLGGKTGADLPQGKNLVGAFHPPAFVLADPQALMTLPDDEFRSGLAEVVKHGLIADPGLYSLCAAGQEVVQANLDEIVRRAIAVKVRIIQEDPYEGGQRAALNLGHTLGHAIEKASGYRLKHGEGVAIGIVHAARLSRLKGLAQDGFPEAVAGTLEGLGLPTEIPGWLDRGSILQAMGFDKKKAGGRLRWVLPVRIGEVATGVAVDDPMLAEYTQ